MIRRVLCKQYPFLYGPKQLLIGKEPTTHMDIVYDDVMTASGLYLAVLNRTAHHHKRTGYTTPLSYKESECPNIVHGTTYKRRAHIH